jgi:transcription termination/antitermination protein NusA
VADDQLSLAIGKHGQNIRLASKLVGWELDVRTKEMAARAALEAIGAPAPAAAAAQEEQKEPEELAVPAKEECAGTSIEDLPGVGEKTLLNLREGGFETLESVAEADIEKLTSVKGIAKKKAETLIKEAGKLLGKKK